VALAPILLLCVVLGVYPQLILPSMERDLGVVVRITKAAKDRAGKTALAGAASEQTVAATAAEREMQ
jgi:hypothetical protein